MKKLFQEHFERTWLIIFLIMLALIIIPFPFSTVRRTSRQRAGFRFSCLDGSYTRR